LPEGVLGADEDDENYLQLEKGELITPLYKAHKMEQTRSVNLILKYQSVLDYSSFDTFKGILHELIDYKNFNDYLYEQPFETV
jgi:hypothetical protein